MPFIEESDLLDLHKDLDKAQIINERLLDQIKFKNKDLKKIIKKQYKTSTFHPTQVGCTWNIEAKRGFFSLSLPSYYSTYEKWNGCIMYGIYTYVEGSFTN